MSRLETLKDNVETALGGLCQSCTVDFCELTVEVASESIIEALAVLRDNDATRFQQLIDLCGVDYLNYTDHLDWEWDKPRYAVVYHLQSIEHNWRMRVRAFVDDEAPMIASAIELWPIANWLEREAFDVMGIMFSGHPDLRRILTDYGFIGHPFRKDFPVSGHVEMRYDEEKRRVVYEPVSIEPRILTPRIRREVHEQGE